MQHLLNGTKPIRARLELCRRKAPIDLSGFDFCLWVLFIESRNRTDGDQWANVERFPSLLRYDEIGTDLH